MRYHYCLNCGDTTEKNFCSNCGQKTDTHRITPKHFFFHDIIHGVWHLDKGILFTLKEAVTRPGQAALDYIKGKRISYYNVFYLCLIFLGLNIFVNHYYDEVLEIQNNNQGASLTLDMFVRDNIKLFVFAFIPIFALCSSIVYKRMKLNYAEHFIPAGILLLLILASSVISLLVGLIDAIVYFPVFSKAVSIAFTILIVLVLPVYVYYNFSIKYYSTREAVLKVAGFYFLLLGFIALLGLIFILISTIVFFEGKGFRWEV